MNGRNYPDDYLKKLLDELNENVNDITMNNFDDIIEESRSKIDNFYSNAKLQYELSKTKKKQQTDTKKSEAENSINPNIKKMYIGQNDLKEASKYTRFYTYKVQVIEHRNSDKINHVFTMDNSFFNKLFKKPTDRFEHRTNYAGYHSIVFKYNPKKAREIVDGEIIYFEPFQIEVSTKYCQDFVFYHTPKNSSNKEVLKGVYVINIQKVIDKLKDIYNDLQLSDKAKTNMELSLRKHLNYNQSSNMPTGDEDYYGYSEEIALMILDDYDDGDLVESLGSYILD